jgi:glycogen operon protein
VVDDSFLLAFNAHYEDIEVTLPDVEYGPEWTMVVDTTTGKVGDGAKPIVAGGQLTLTARSLVVLQRVG